MESISLLLGEALSPYQVTLTPRGAHGECLVTLRNSNGALVVEREFNLSHAAQPPAAIDAMVAVVRPLNLPAPVLISPPSDRWPKSPDWPTATWPPTSATWATTATPCVAA